MVYVGHRISAGERGSSGLHDAHEGGHRKTNTVAEVVVHVVVVADLGVLIFGVGGELDGPGLRASWHARKRPTQNGHSELHNGDVVYHAAVLFGEDLVEVVRVGSIFKRS